MMEEARSNVIDSPLSMMSAERLHIFRVHFFDACVCEGHFVLDPKGHAPGRSFVSEF